MYKKRFIETMIKWFTVLQRLSKEIFDRRIENIKKADIFK